MIYICFMMLFAFASLLDFSKNQAALKNVTAKYLFVILVCFVGLRYYTGSDWSGYISYFNNVRWNDGNSRWGFGFKLLNLLCKSVYESYYLVQFISSLFFAFSIAEFLRKYAKYKFTCLFLALTFYFDDLFMAQVRQSLAISILLLGTTYLLEKKWLKYFLVVILAALFHVTAIVAVFTVFLLHPFSKRTRIVTVVFGFVLILKPSLSMTALTFAAEFVPGKIGSLFRMYLAGYFSRGAELTTGVYFMAKQLLALLIVIFFNPKNKNEHFMLNALVANIFINDFSIAFMMMARIGFYIGFYAIVGWTYFFDIKLLRQKKDIFAVALMLFLGFFIVPTVKNWLPTNQVSDLTGRPVHYQSIPYWNVFHHPEGAYRLDWCE